MTRLKTRVNPEISASIRSFIRSGQATVRVKIRIDETGNVTVNDVQGESLAVNNSVRTALERWKFAPAIDQTGPRCVDTEITIVITP
jgi:TonB family protein